MTREQALSRLLSPIEWHPSSSIPARKALVVRRHERLDIVLPFLTEEEKDKAEKWRKEEQHNGLWD
jgi:hypothetical protein